ncbi:ATP-binding protein [Allonocardiopsis opalescens]|uniref:histidine kinase n=1 Tax=Allonocardiopsis opalescens TaxID=1144618 RepID=A0A2T0Q009_9ACTN|nr:ATP-binding protein [Allonocardiopsis opalescens]PRX97106.1 histidine kinase/DNA gyrase B/HSP90-like ATPase [Allonocardiopsis opalescens]
MPSAGPHAAAAPSTAAGGAKAPPAAVDIERLRSVELFARLSDDNLRWLVEVGRPVHLDDGEVLFEDGERARYFYVLLRGQLVITKMRDGREELYGRHTADPPRPGGDGPADRRQDGPGPAAPADPPDGKPRAAHQFTGELPLLVDGDYLAKATASGRTELIAYDKPTFLELLGRCPTICAVLLPVLAWRIRDYEARAGHTTMLEGLGTLAAGLAHELNNPAAAIVRAAASLRDAVQDLSDQAARWGRLASPAERRVIDGFVRHLSAEPPAARDALEAAELTDEVVDWLDAQGFESADDIGAVLADSGASPDTLARIAESVRPDALEAALACAAQVLNARSLVDEITGAGRRIDALVRATRGYTDLDRAPEHDVDLHDALEATLTVLAPRLSGVRVQRRFGELPALPARPSELNQVWVHLITNAADAMGADGVLTITTSREGDCALVEIRDNGRGIPPELLPSLFQPFFTTKDIGKGTGLGLHLCRDIVSQRHGGSIEVSSVPGDTRFTVRLPLRH